MKKNLLLFSALVGTFLFLSCSPGNKKETAAVNNMSETNAREIIRYYDTSLNVLKMMVNEKEMNVILELMNQRGKSPVAPAITPYMLPATDSVSILNPDTCFNTATRQSLIQNYTGLMNARTLFYANYDTYRTYINKKGFSKDNYAEAAKLLDDSYRQSMKMSEFKQVIFDELSFVTSEAEKVVLAGNPLKEQMMARRKITLSMQMITSLVTGKEKNETKINEETDSLRNELGAARKLPVVTGNESEQKSFEAFLLKADAFMKALEKMRQDSDYKEALFNTLNSAYETSIN